MEEKESFNRTTSKKDEERRRNLRWLSFAKSKISFGFKHLNPAYVPLMGANNHSFCIVFDKICNWSIPPLVQNEFSRGRGDYSMVVQLSLSMFHLNSSSFFGSTWLGPEIELPDDLPRFIDFKYEDIVYMTSRITDPSCVGVVELVVTKLDTKRNMRLGQFGCGWTIINLFNKPIPPDVAHGDEQVTQTSCTVFTGSPRELVINTDVTTLADRLVEMPDCNIFFKLFSHQKMTRMQKLICENEVLGRFDVVPGLLQKLVTPPGSTQSRMLACIGDEEKIDPNHGVTIVPSPRPRLAMSSLVNLVNCQLSIPNREKLELKVNRSFANNVIANNRSIDAGRMTPEIINRTLKVGIHNGHTMVGGDWKTYQLLEDAKDREILYTAAELISIRGYVPHELMAIVFIVEYEVGYPAKSTSHFDSHAMVNTSGNFPTVGSKPLSTETLHTLTVGAALFIPSNGKVINLKNTQSVSATIGDDEQEVVEGVDVELRLLRDEYCTLLSPKPLLQDPTATSHANADDDAIVAGAAVDGKIAGLTKSKELSKSQLVSTVKSRTSNNELDKVTNLQLTNTVQDSVTIKDEFQSDLDSMILGFDIKVVHPTVGELLHGEDIDELLNLEENSVVRDDEKDDKDDDDSDDRVLKTKTFRQSFESPSSLKRSKRLLRKSGDDYDDLVDLDLEDDRRSIAMSPRGDVDVDKKDLRLDPSYYHRMGKGWHEAYPEDDASNSADSGVSVNGGSYRDATFRYHSKLPSQGKDSLLARSLHSKLVSKDHLSIVEPNKGDAEMLQPHQPMYSYPRYSVPKTSIAEVSIAINGIAAHTRGISRRARSRLNRHGFQGAMMDSPFDTALEQIRPGLIRGSSSVQPKTALNNIEVELEDKLCVHEISIQFAGYRHGPYVVDRHSNQVQTPHYSPKSLYCHFQFYTCLPTRTEVMRLLMAEPGQTCVLVRDAAQVRDETPLALRYIIDCSSSSPTEPREFADYLSYSILFVEVWDADSLILIGNAGIPLAKLLRQGQPFTKSAIECDVINSDIISSIGQQDQHPNHTNGGVTTTVVADGGPMAGSVVGSIHVILSNTGTVGKGPNRPKAIKNIPQDHNYGLNWRAFGVENINRNVEKSPGHRPKNSVRAKPLSENVPELSKALVDVRTAGVAAGHAPISSMRSLTTTRGDSGGSTLTYDEVSTIFRLFNGPQKGTVQYTGALLDLLDLPSWNIAIRKLVTAFERYNDYEGFKKEMLRYSNAQSRLGSKDLEEFLTYIFEKLSIGIKPEEIVVLSRKFVAEYGKIELHGQAPGAAVAVVDELTVTPTFVVDFCADENHRQSWVVSGNRLRRAVHRAYSEGVDVEQMLSSKDIEGTHYLSVNRFKEFIRELSQYGKLTPRDMTQCCKHFTRRPQNVEDNRPAISLKEVLAFLGIEYVGNLEARIRFAMRVENTTNSGGGGSEVASDEMYLPITANDVLKVLQKYSPLSHQTNKSTPTRNVKGAIYFTFEEIEAAFRELGVYQEVSHEVVRNILVKADKKHMGKLTASQILTQLGIKFTATELQANHLSSTEDEKKGSKLSIDTAGSSHGGLMLDEVDTTQLFNILIEKVQSNGVAVDEAFRHFDANGDGSLTQKELEKGLEGLCIFDHIPNWKKQIPNIVKQFDSDGDGNVSLKEFFKFLKVDYAPNIIQRMTKIFAIATLKGMKFSQIFKELDEDGNGTIDVDEIILGLKKLGTFNEITKEDAMSVVSYFDKDSDKKISLDEFTEFFSKRVDQVNQDRRKKQSDRISRRFRQVMNSVQSKGVTAKTLFSHFDKDHGGSVTHEELAEALKKLPNFSTLNEQDIQDLIQVLDYDNSGDITLEEFEAFLRGDEEVSASGDEGDAGIEKNSRTIIDSLRDIFATAQSKGLSFEQAFSILDKDRSREIDLNELETVLRKFPNFKNMSRKAIQAVFRVIDVDDSKTITIEEFEKFVKQGKAIEMRRKDDETTALRTKSQEIGEMERNNNFKQKSSAFVAAKAASQGDLDGVKDLLIRHVRRIAEIDGSISRLLAYLDDDGDGIISLSAFKNILRREDVFDSISEDHFDELMKPLLMNEGAIKVPQLLRFLEGKSATKYPTDHALDRLDPFDQPLHELQTEDGKEEDEKESWQHYLPNEYKFSNDVEVRTLEKKVRGFGRILARKGVDVEGVFHAYDPRSTGCIKRTEFIEVLSKLGMYILEQGKVFDQAMHPDTDIRRLQVQQINRVKVSTAGDYLNNAPRLARRLVMNAGLDRDTGGEFKDHLESMTLINWYRQVQKQTLLQKVLSHSLSTTIQIYPRFGKALFFEQPLTNPFAHEERFIIEINDPELRLVTSFDQWLQLRTFCRPCVGELGKEPVEAEMFDKDGHGNVQVALLPHEELHVPFTFMTLLPYVPDTRFIPPSHGKKTKPRMQESKFGEEKDRRDSSSSKEDRLDEDEDEVEEIPRRVIEVKFISGSHGHIVSVIKVHVCPRPFILNRIIRFCEPENSIMKRRIQLVGHDNMSLYPGEFTSASKYIHCVEGGSRMEVGDGQSAPEQSRVVVEWSSSHEQFKGVGSLDLLIRYRCGSFPSAGMFYLLIYNDPYQCQLHEVWQVLIQTAQRVDIHASVGGAAACDLVIRGDRYARRAKAFSSVTPFDRLTFQPDNVFQIVPGAYNRVMVSVNPQVVGHRRIQLNMVDVDSRELINSWIVILSSTIPAIMRTYDINLFKTKPIHKKIIFKNPWDVARRFTLSSSDDNMMRPRSTTIDVAPYGSAYLRLWFNSLDAASKAATNLNFVRGHGTNATSLYSKEVYLFLNDFEGGQNEECYLFKIKEYISGEDDA